MKIGIFVYSIKIGAVGGVQQYAERLIFGLSKYSDFGVVVFCSPENSEHFRKYLGKAQDKIYTIKSRIKFLKPRVINGILKEIFKNRLVRKNKFLYKITSLIFYNFLTIPLLRLLGDYKLILEKEVDVVHFPYPYLQRYDLQIPAIISFHDLLYKNFPEFFKLKNIEKMENYFKSSAEVSTRIIVSFSHVRYDLVKFYGIQADKIDVCRPGLDIDNNIVEQKMKKNFERHKIPQDYLIYPAAPSPHKNHVRLIQALDLLHNKYNKKVSLVITGSKYASDYYYLIEKEIKKFNLENYVVFTDYISSQEELYALMKRSLLVVVPALYEAGSGPVDEALIMNIPVIGSEKAGLPEQIGEKEFMFDPYNIEEMAEKINLMLTDDKIRQRNLDNCKRQAEKIKWENSINSFVDCYNKALKDFYKND